MEYTEDADRRELLLHSAYDSDTVRAMERPLLDKGVPLMRMAAQAAAHWRPVCWTTRIWRWRTRRSCCWPGPETMVAMVCSRPPRWPRRGRERHRHRRGPVVA